MGYCAGDTIYVSFTTADITGAPTNADALPTGAVRVNGVNDGGVSVTVTNNATGDYTASATLGSYAPGHTIELVILATVDGVSQQTVIPLGVVEVPNWHILYIDGDGATAAGLLSTSAQSNVASAVGGVQGFGVVVLVSSASDPTTNGTNLLAAINAATAGTLVVAQAGTFNTLTNPLDIPAGVTVRGAGIDRTIIQSAAALTDGNCCATLSDGAGIENLTIQGTLTGTNEYQVPLGVLNPSGSVTATARNVKLMADSDGIYVNVPGLTVTLDAWNCELATKYDAVNLVHGNADSVVNLHNCTITATGPSNCNSGSLARGIACGAGSVNVYSGTVRASGATTTNLGLDTYGTGTINAYGVDVLATGAGAVDLNNAGTALNAVGCVYTTSNGTIGLVVERANDATGAALATSAQAVTITDQTTAAQQQANTQAGLTTQGYTTTRAVKLDNLDEAVGTRSTFAVGQDVGRIGADQSFNNTGQTEALPAISAIATGTARAGAASTIQLATAASASDNYYAGQTISLTSGTGAGQVRTIASYVGSTRTATVDAPWVTVPDNTTVYALPGFVPTVNANFPVTSNTIPVTPGY